MRRRNMFVGAAALFLLPLLLIVHRSRRPELAAANQEANTSRPRPVALAEDQESQKWERMRALQATNVALRQ